MRNFVIAAVLASAAATASFAQLSMAKADWARGPVQYIMTKDEMTAWNAIKSDADADQFIALFWARRDPTPATPQNEFRGEFEGRVQYADQNFANGRQRGSLTDRGKALVLFGAPTRALRTPGRALTQPPADATSTAVGSETDDTVGERQTWIYEGATAEKLFNAPKVEIRFVDRLNNKEMRMETPRFDFAAASQRVITAGITQPNLTSVPKQQAQQPVPPPAAVPAAPVAPMTVLKTAAFETAVAAAKAGKGTAKNTFLSYAEFVAPRGGYYAPLGVYVTGSSGLTADSADTFFGVIEDSTGKRVLAFEEPAKLTASKADFFVDRTLDLPAGKYTAIVGLAKAGTPVTVTSGPIELAPATTGTSRMILSDNVYELPEAAPVKSPFAFGKLKIVPKASMQFTNKDELNYFVELHNPTLDATTNLPKLQMKLDLVDSKGKTVAGAPLSDAQALPLSGAVGPGEYAIISGIPLSQMAKPLPPGEYTLKMRILDTISKQSYNLEQKFKITA
ncbi:MAG: GWxTD domain-containing protein [Acidobacteriota bacterium]|nr:GWxTD domain-containing protein [Acidobacteriota bacterium]